MAVRNIVKLGDDVLRKVRKIRMERGIKGEN